MADQTGTATDSPAPLCTPADRQLVDGCLAGTPEAWDILLKRYGRLIGHVVNETARRRQAPLSGDDADDLVAEVFAELISRNAAALRLFSGRSTLATYFTVIARRVTVRRLTRTNVRLVASADGVTDQPDGHPTATEAVAHQDEIEHLLNLLPEEDRTLLRMHDYEGHSYGEISQATGVPVGSIGPRLSRARETLRRATNDKPDDKPPGAGSENTTEG